MNKKEQIKALHEHVSDLYDRFHEIESEIYFLKNPVIYSVFDIVRYKNFYKDNEKTGVIVKVDRSRCIPCKDYQILNDNSKSIDFVAEEDIIERAGKLLRDNKGK
jgi:hypothetical protein